MSFLTNKFVMMILPVIIQSISPILISQLRPLIDQLRETAISTPNPWDNIFVQILDDIIGSMADTYQKS